MFNKENLTKMLEIDKDNLEIELLHQAQLFADCGEQYADACGKRDTAKHISDLKAAQLANDYRSSALDKVTEAKVNAYVEAHSEYIEQYKFYLQYKSEAEHWEALKSAYSQRATMLRDLVQLLTVGYWGTGLPNTANLDKVYSEKYRAYHQKDDSKEE